MLKSLLALLFAALPLAAAPAQPTRFTVTVEGSGPDLILIPGLTSSRQVWDQAVAGLGGHYRVHRVQIGGFGGAPAGGNAAAGPVLAPVVEELHAYIAANHLARPLVAGHSVGGLLTLMLAQRHPEDVSRALIVDALPFYPLLFDVSATPASVEPQAAGFRDAVAAMSAEAWRGQQEASVARMVTTPEGRARVLADSAASDRGVVARAIYDDLVTDMRPALPAIHVPLTVIYAVNPTASEATYGRLMRGAYTGAPDIRFVPVEPSAHFIMLDQPVRFGEILAAFAAGTDR